MELYYLILCISLLMLAIVVGTGFFWHMRDKKRTSVLIREQDKSTKLLIRRDLELMRANEKLRALDIQKSEFISIIAHQMRTPISAMKWTLSMMLKGELGPLTVDQHTFMLKADESNNHMISLVEDMLLADRLDRGKVQIERTEIDMSDIISTVLHDLRFGLEKKNIKVHFTPCEPGLCKAFGDKDKMRSVIQNILENAQIYSPKDGNIYIQTFDKDHKLYISIRDEGIGIPEDQQAFLFTKFYRARNAQRLVANGSGLGLFIAKSILEGSGGGISFESAENKGTTFTLFIPNK